MHLSRFLFPAALAATLLVAHSPLPADAPKAKTEPSEYEAILPEPDTEWLKKAKVDTSDAGLLAFLKTCHGPELTPADIEKRVDALVNAPTAGVAGAKEELAKAGALAVPALRRRIDAPRVRESLAEIEEAQDKPLARPCMRRLLVRRPAGTAEALVGYVPFAFDPEAELDVYYGLDKLIDRDPKTLASLVPALKDGQPARRAVAACILGRRGSPEQRAAVRGMLADADAMVRLRAAQGLLAGKDASGLDTLIALLDEPAVETCWQAEELLRWLSNETAPDAVIGRGDPTARKACQAAWRTWAKDNAAKIDFAVLENEPRRPLLLLGYRWDSGKLWIFGSDGVTRHEWATRRQLADAQYVPGGRIVTIHGPAGVDRPVLAEHASAGKDVWQHGEIEDPKYVQRRSNGHVFVADYHDATRPFLRYRVVATGGMLHARERHWPTVNDRFSAVRMTDDGHVATATFNFLNTPHYLTGMYEHDPANGDKRIRPLVATSVRMRGKTHLEPVEWGGFLLSGVQTSGLISEGVFESDYFGVKTWQYWLPGATHGVRLRGGTNLLSAPDGVIEASADRRWVGEIPSATEANVSRPCLPLVRFGFDRFADDQDLNRGIEHRAASLTKANPLARLRALKHLKAWGGRAGRFIPDVARLAADPDPRVRAEVRPTQLALGLEAIPPLLTEARHANPDNRVAALTNLRPYVTVETGAAFREALTDQYPAVRRAAAAGLGYSEPDPQELYNRDVRVRAARHWEAEKNVAALVKVLSSEKDDLNRSSTLVALETYGQQAKAAVPALMRVIRDREATPENRGRAASTLGRIGPVSADDRSILYQVMVEDAPGTPREMIVFALSRWRPPSAETIRKLIEAYHAASGVPPPGSEYSAKESFLGGLCQLGYTDPKVRELLASIVADDKEPRLHRFYAAEALLRSSDSAVARGFCRPYALEEDPRKLRTIEDIGASNGGRAVLREWARRTTFESWAR